MHCELANSFFKQLETTRIATGRMYPTIATSHSEISY